MIVALARGVDLAMEGDCMQPMKETACNPWQETACNPWQETACNP